MDSIVAFVQLHKPFFDVAQAVSSAVNLLAWLLAFAVLVVALRRRRVESLSVGPFRFRMQQEEAILATAAASRAWQTEAGPKVDVARIRTTLGRSFTPDVADNLIGKSILWVDDNPTNNKLAVRALTKFGLVIDEATSTETGWSKLHERRYDLVISDMGRGANMRAGYEFLERIRSAQIDIPFFIFSGSDKPEYRQEAARQGAQLSTNDMLELVDEVVTTLGRAP